MAKTSHNFILDSVPMKKAAKIGQGILFKLRRLNKADTNEIIVIVMMLIII